MPRNSSLMDNTIDLNAWTSPVDQHTGLHCKTQWVTNEQILDAVNYLREEVESLKQNRIKGGIFIPSSENINLYG